MFINTMPASRALHQSPRVRPSMVKDITYRLANTNKSDIQYYGLLSLHLIQNNNKDCTDKNK